MGLILNKGNSNFIYPVNKAVDGLISASNGIMCLAQGIFGAASMLLNPGAILQGLANVAAGMIESITYSVTEVIRKRVNQIIQSALSPLRKIEMIITDLTTLLIEAQNVIDKATNMDNYFKKRQECASMAAQLMNCIAQNAINKITAKVTMDVDKHVGKLADSISKDCLKADGVIDNFTRRQAKFMDKASLQNKLLL